MLLILIPVGSLFQAIPNTDRGMEGSIWWPITMTWHKRTYIELACWPCLFYSPAGIGSFWSCFVGWSLDFSNLTSHLWAIYIRRMLIIIYFYFWSLASWTKKERKRTNDIHPKPIASLEMVVRKDNVLSIDVVPSLRCSSETDKSQNWY